MNFSNKLSNFSQKKLFLLLRILSRVFLLAFGVFLLIDDLLWDNIGGLGDITGMVPTIGVVKTYEIGGVHIHHGYIGFLLMLMAGTSLLFMYVNEIKHPSNGDK